MSPSTRQLCTYFFKSSVKLSAAHVKEMTTLLQVSDHLPNPPVLLIGPLYWHTYVFQQGANKDEHHGKDFLLKDGTQVQLSVSDLATDALQVVNETKKAVDFLATLKALPEKEVAQLHDAINYYMIEGHFAITERASQIQYITEEFVKYGAVEFIAKRIIPRFGTEIVDFLAQLDDEEKKKKIEGFLVTAISIGISTYNAVNNVRDIVNTRAQFTKQVKAFLPPVLLTIRQLRGYNNSVVKLLEQYIDSQDEKILEAIPITLDFAAGVLADLLEKIPTIEKSIANFIDAKQKTQAEKKKQAWAALLLSLPSGFQAVSGVYKLATEGANALNALQKLDLAFDTARFAAYAAEFGTAKYAYDSIGNSLEEAEKHLKFYTTIRNKLNAETLNRRDNQLRALIEDGAGNMYIFMPLLDQFKLQLEDLDSLIKMGEEL